MAKNAAIEKKALAAETKSEGMRMLFEAGYSVAEVKEIFGVGYGFAYGVASRGGYVTATPRTAKPKAEKAATRPARPVKAAAKAPAKAKAPARPARPAKAPARKAGARR